MSSHAVAAESATNDSQGQQINATYIKGLSISGTTITITKGNGTTSTITTQDTNSDTKVNTKLATTTKAYLLATSTTPTSSNQAVESVADTGVYLDTTAGMLTATTFKGNLQGNADTATKATKDSDNQQITTTYIKGLSLDGLTLTITKGNGGTSTLTLQDLDIKMNVKARGTTKAYLLGTTTSPTNSDQAVTGVAETGVYFDTTAAKLVATTFKGALEGNADTATKATQDSAGQQINTTYIKELSVSGTTITITKGNGNTSTITTQDTNTDTKVNMVARGTTKAYLLATTTSPTSSVQGVTSVAETGVYFDTTAAKLVATTFKGSLEGNAATATSATYDSNNQEIYKTYIKGLSISGRTITYTKGDGSTGTLTTQDTDTDTKVNVTLGTTTKAYLLGTSTTPTATAQGVTAIADTGVYLDTTAGTLTATAFKGNLAWSYLTSVPQMVEGAVGSTISTGYQIQLYDLAGGAILANTSTPAKNGLIVIPLASTTSMGLVSTETQSFVGDKTFTSNVYINTQTGSKKFYICRTGSIAESTAMWQDDSYMYFDVTNDETTANVKWTLHATDTEGGNGVGAQTSYITFTGVNGKSTITADNLSGKLAWSNLTNVPQIVKGAKGTTATNKYTITLYNLSGAAIVASADATNGVIDIPAATASIAGLITTGDQTMAGAKTFSTSISTPQLTVTGANKFEYSGIQADTANADRVVWFAYNGKNGIPVYDNDFKYNPSTNKLTVSNIASSAITLSSGNDSTHSTEDATLKVTGGVSVSLRLSAKMIRVDNGSTDTTKGFNLIYDSTNECLKFQFGN